MKRPTPSMAVSIAALVVAMGGTSYAAATINTGDIADEAVNTAKIKQNTITSGDIRDGFVKSQDLAPGVRNGLEGPQGPAGQDGADGEDGMDGADGADGADGTDGTGRWLLINAAGEIEAQSGGFTLVTAYPTLPNTAPAGSPSNELRANGNVYINSGEDLGNNGLLASIVLQNTVDQNGDAVTTGRAVGADANPEFSGEISVSRCNVGAPTTPPAGRTNCAPGGAQNANSFVVSPRNSDGSVTADGTRKSFYVVVTGDSSEVVAPVR